MTINGRRRLLLRTMAAAAIVVGILSLLGIRPMNSRTIEIVLGSASLIAGVVLFALTLRPKSVAQASLA